MTTSLSEVYPEFGKIPRLSREIVISEKLDGTNAQIEIKQISAIGDRPIVAIRAGSRTRWLTKEDDNQGFCAWVSKNAEELLMGLGIGNHFGEWWGRGIQRGYGLNERRFSLFNSARWADRYTYTALGVIQTTLREGQLYAPDCCNVAPVLYRGPFETGAVDNCIGHLKAYGSYAAPGFMAPEGVVVFHTAANLMFKKTLERDEAPKGKVKA